MQDTVDGGGAGGFTTGERLRALEVNHHHASESLKRIEAKLDSIDDKVNTLSGDVSHLNGWLIGGFVISGAFLALLQVLLR